MYYDLSKIVGPNRVKKADFYSEITEIEDDLKHSDKKVADLSQLQSRLDGLMYRYEEDESLGRDRFALYQLQALISYYNGEFGKSKRYLDYSVALSGRGNETVDQLYAHLMKKDFEAKSTKRWWGLIIFPFVALFLVALLQLIIHFVFSSSSGSNTKPLVSTLINTISIVIGALAVIVLLFIPIWIIRLRRVKKYNADHGYSGGLKRRSGIWIAILFGWWYWAAYTYEIDKRKVWWNLLGIIVTVGYWGVVAWIWTIINAASRSQKFYALYPYYNPKKRA